MEPLAKLAGRELLEYGIALTAQLRAAQEKKDFSVEDCCEVCGEERPLWHTTLEEMKLESHPWANADGVVTFRGPCQSPSCKDARDKRIADLSTGRKKDEEQAFFAQLESAGIRYMDCDFANFNTEWPTTESHKAALRMVKEKLHAWAQQPKGFVILSGGYGCGKTHLAVAALRVFLWKEVGHGAFHLACCEAWEAIKATWDSREKTIRYRDREVTVGGLISKCKEARLLIIDDMDKVEPSTGWYGWLLPIINYRTDRSLPTIITLNHPLKQMESFMTGQRNGKRVTWADKAKAMWDRVMGETGEKYRLQFPADQPSYRRK